MKLLLLLITAFCVCSCNSLSQNNESFVIREYSIESDTTLEEAFLHNNYYYCLSNKKDFIVLNKHFRIDTSITSRINKQDFNFVFLHKDTLIAGRFNKDYSRQYYFLSGNHTWLVYNNEIGPPPFFEDNKYTASRCCFGEFGGSVSFQEKGTKNVYGLPATCPVAINKLNGQYYITASLSHGSGFTKIFHVKNPKNLFNLQTIQPDSLRRFCNWAEMLQSNRPRRITKDLEVGATVLLDTMGIQTLASFTLNGKLYHLNTSSNYTTIGRIEAKRMFTMDTINNKPTWSYRPIYKQYPSSHIYSFANGEASGFIVINKDTLSTIIFHQ